MTLGVQPTSSTASRTEARRLWELCFEDSPEFVDFYFEHVFDPHEAYLYYDELGRGMAHLHAKVYEIYTGGEAGSSLSAFYVSGACTHPDHRGQGVMASLMAEVMRAEAEQGRQIAFLIPADEDLRVYYHKHFGFQTNNYRCVTTSLAVALDTLSGYPLASLEASDFLYQAECLSLGRGLRHTAKDWRHICLEYEMSPEAAVLIHRASDRAPILAVALVRWAEETLWVDGLYGAAEAAAELVRAQAEAHPSHRTKITLPSHSGSHLAERMPRAMVRPLAFAPLLKDYADRHPGEPIACSIVDELLPHNTGSYYRDDMGQIIFVPGSLTAPRLSIPDFVARFVPEYDLRFLHE